MFLLPRKLIASVFAYFIVVPIYAQEVLAPPTILKGANNETIEGTRSQSSVEGTTSNSTPESPQQNQSKELLGSTAISELRRENGQVYRIELQHSSGAMQIIEETDLDGYFESTSNDLQDTPILPKWRLSTW